MMHLAIMLLTYKRTDYAVSTIRSVLRHTKFDGDLAVHVADDGSPPEHVEAIMQAIRPYRDELAFVSHSNAQRGGYGANYNLGTQAVHEWADAVLPLEDDWEMLRQVDLTPFAQTVLDGKIIDCVRLGYLGWTQDLDGRLVQLDGHTYLLLDPESAEPHVFAGHPRIESVERQRYVGPWPTGKLPGDTEFEVAHRRQARQGVAWPMAIDPRAGCGIFAHIGARREWD